MDLKGYYIKSGQVISTRVDLFPAPYTTKLQVLQDGLEPISPRLVKALVSQELLEGEPLNTLFSEFDEEPLGSASIAQVHRAVLLDGRVVAVKVQRPGEEPKLRGDVQNLKSFALRLRERLPLDFYPVFCELEKALSQELDFLSEAQSLEKIAAAVAHTPDGRPARPPLLVPRPVPGLCSTRVLVMEYVDGVPLNRLAAAMAERGVAEGSPEARLLGRRLLEALTEAFARMLFGPGFIHADPHPGNIFITKSGGVALIDCGQVKQLPSSQKLRLASLVSSIRLWEKPGGPTTQELAAAVSNFGVTVREEAGDDCLAAVALLLFGATGAALPGGYSNIELSDDSPLKALKSFPQEMVMMGRATVLIKGIASRLGIPWDLGAKWADAAAMAADCGIDGCTVPIYATFPSTAVGGGGGRGGGNARGGRNGAGGAGSRPRFSEVRASFRGLRVIAGEWAVGKSFEALPGPLKRRLLRWLANAEDARAGAAPAPPLSRQRKGKGGGVR
ncbi:unnamed protein product [Phaeothamnion confervicola]